jgi:flagellar basal body-associated protein FliL
MSGQIPESPGQPPEKKGLSTGAIVAIIIVALVLLLFGVCIAAPMLFSGA